MHEFVLSFILNRPLLPIFLKYFGKLEGLREVTHISPNWCLFGSYSSWNLIGNRQHEGSLKICWKRVIGRCTGLWCPASGQFTGGEPTAEGVTERWNSVLSASDQKELQCLVDHEDIKARWPDSGCVRLVSTGRIWSWFQRNWTSLESTRRWVVASGRYHWSVR